MLSCVIYTIVDKYVCIDYLGSEKSKLSDLHLGGTGKDRHNDTDYDNVLGIGITDLLLNLLSCHGFLKNNDSVVILKCPNRMSEYYFNKGLVIFECDEENEEKLPSEVKYRVSAEVAVDSDLVMPCFTNIPSTSKTLIFFLVGSNYHSSYTTQEFNTKKEQMSTIFNTYVTPQTKEIKHP